MTLLAIYIGYAHASTAMESVVAVTQDSAVTNGDRSVTRIASAQMS